MGENEKTAHPIGILWWKCALIPNQVSNLTNDKNLPDLRREASVEPISSRYNGRYQQLEKPIPDPQANRVQGVAGSNPAVPICSRLFFKIPTHASPN
jgi:hypothetical protein